MQTYGLVPSRNLIMAQREMLAHAEPITVLSSFGIQKTMPQNRTDTLVMRRALPIDYSTSTTNGSYGAPQVDPTNYQLQEGVTPSAKTITYQDVSVVLQEYGVLLKLSSKAEATYEDNIPADMTQLVGEHMATLQEMIAYNAVKGGTNVMYQGGTSRATVAAAPTLNKLRQAARMIESAHGKRVTKKLAAGPNFGTSAILPSYLVFMHTDMESDVRNLPGFTPMVEYATGTTVHEREIGAVEQFRFITSPYLRPFLNAGATAAANAFLAAGIASTGSNQADVYPLLIVAEEAWGQLALKGLDAVKPIYLPAKQVNHANPLGRFGYVGAQFMKAAVRLNEQWMVRYECLATYLS